jgi:hypothetical protein
MKEVESSNHIHFKEYPRSWADLGKVVAEKLGDTDMGYDDLNTLKNTLRGGGSISEGKIKDFLSRAITKLKL